MRSQHQRKGFVLVYTTLTVLVMIPLIGLAIDSGRVYTVKAKLQTALDGAVLGSARSLSRTNDIAGQITAIRNAGDQFFNANFPPAFWGSINLSYNVNPWTPDSSTLQVDAQASVDVPLLFMQFAGWGSQHVDARAMARRRYVNCILVLDRSGSLSDFAAVVKSNAQTFVSKFADGRDNIGIVTFSGNWLVDYTPSLYFKSGTPTAASVISAVQFAGNTNTAAGLWKGYQQLVTLNQPGALNTIVFFTDGRPTALSGNFPVKTVADTRYILTRVCTTRDRWGNCTRYTNAYVLTNVGASTCTSTLDKVGFVNAPAGFSDTGVTWGVHQDVSTGEGFSDDAWASNVSGCKFRVDSDDSEMRYDIAYIPDQDRFGNSTLGYKTMTAYLFPTGHPYAGHIRTDSQAGLRYAGYNAADSAAQRLRANDTLKPVVYTIGLGGTGGVETIDDELLKRLANDPTSSSYDSSKPAGKYYYATPDNLDEAYNKVAAEILRLAM